MNSKAKFALVLWTSDPKPECWQVISTGEILSSNDLEEGKTYDAVWDPKEETSPATVLKLGGESNCQQRERILLKLCVVR